MILKNRSNENSFNGVFMKGSSKESPGQIGFISPDLIDRLNPRRELVILADRIPWDLFDEEFSKLCSSKTGRPSKPVRRMAGLLILKQMENLSGERIVEARAGNPYMQYFCGENRFQREYPCDPSDLTYFRKRIGAEGAEIIFQVSMALHGKKALEKEATVDTTVQEKNITFPTDSKLRRKIVERCRRKAKEENVALRRSYTRTVKKLIKDQRFASHPRNRKKAAKARKKLKTIAGRLVRELERKLSEKAKAGFEDQLKMFRKVLNQKRNGKNKIYSLHEPDVYCMSKGEEHKKYEFGAKASIAAAKNGGIIAGALSFAENVYDGHTLDQVMDQIERLRGSRPEVGICDRGCRGQSRSGDALIVIPKPPRKKATACEKRKARKRFGRRAAIEPVIGHLKSDYRMKRNYLKGITGDSINVLMSAAAFNFKKLPRRLIYFFVKFSIAFNRGKSEYYFA